MVVVTKEDTISNKMMSLDAVAPCSHEEADTRIFVHAWDATQGSCKSLIIKANGIDVVIIAVSVLPSLQHHGLRSMLIDFWQGASARWIPVHELLSAIGPQTARRILYFHAFTGCGVVSAFHGKGKKSAWLTSAWDVCKEISETFSRLSHCPTGVSDAYLQKLETFVVHVQHIKCIDWCGRGKAGSLCPQTQSLWCNSTNQSYLSKEHVKRAAYQAGII